MENDKEKLSRFINAVNSSTDEQVNKIIGEAKEERKKILAAAALSAKDAGQRSLSENKKMSSGKYVRMVSKAELEMKKEVLICREELTDSLFENVENMLREFRKSKEYPLLLEKRLKEEMPSDGAVIALSPDDMVFAERLKKAAGCSVSVTEDDTIRHGGFCILRTDRGTVTDRTFDCVLNEQRSCFASKNILSAGGGELS